MTREIPVTQARADLADLVNRVAYSGERIMLTRHGKPLAALVPVDDLESLERPGESSGEGRGEIGFELSRADVPVQPHSRPAGAPAPPSGAPGEGGQAPADDPLRIAAHYRPGHGHRPRGG